METSSPCDDVKISTYVFIDFETTGLLDLKRNCKITELSLIAVDRIDIHGPGVLPRILDKLTLCINPVKPITACSSRITGLYNDSLEQKKAFTADTVQFINYFLSMQTQPVCLLAHNGNRFDFPLLVAELKHINQSLADTLLCADTLEMYRSLDGLSPRYQPYSSPKVGTYTASPGPSIQTTPNKQITSIQTSSIVGNCNQTTPNKQTMSLRKSSNPRTSVESTPNKPTMPVLPSPASPQKRKLSVTDDATSNISPKIGRQSDDINTFSDSHTEQLRQSREKVKMALTFDDKNKLTSTDNKDRSVKRALTEVSNNNTVEKADHTSEVRSKLTADNEHLQEFSNSIEDSDYLQALDEVETSLYGKEGNGNRNSTTKEKHNTSEPVSKPSVPVSVSSESVNVQSVPVIEQSEQVGVASIPVSVSERTDVTYSSGYLVKHVSETPDESAHTKVQNVTNNNENTIEKMRTNKHTTKNNDVNTRNDDVIAKNDDVIAKNDDVITKNDDVIKTGDNIHETGVTVKEEPVTEVLCDPLGTNTNAAIKPTTNSTASVTPTVSKPDISFRSPSPRSPSCVTTGSYSACVISKSSLSTLAGAAPLHTPKPSTPTNQLASPVKSLPGFRHPSSALCSPTTTRHLASPTTTRLVASPSTSSPGSPSGRYLSYKLEEIYLRKFGCKPPVSHCAEDDCIALLKVVKCTPLFMEWVDKHAVLFSTVPMPY